MLCNHVNFDVEDYNMAMCAPFLILFVGSLSSHWLHNRHCPDGRHGALSGYRDRGSLHASSAALPVCQHDAYVMKH